MEVIGIGKETPILFPPHSGPGFRASHSGPENLALPADFHFPVPVLFRFPPADRPVDEPAEVPYPELPGRTGLPEVRRAFADFPAGAGVPSKLIFPRRKEKHLALDERRDLPPPLLEALHRADGSSQELSHLLLGFLQALAEGQEFSGVHKRLRPPKKKIGAIFSLDIIYHTVILNKTIFSSLNSVAQAPLNIIESRTAFGCRKLKSLRPSG